MILLVLIAVIIVLIGVKNGFLDNESGWLIIVLIHPLMYIVYISWILCIIAGIGLLKHKNWARIMLIVLAIIGLLNFPIGTGLGIWWLIVLFKPEVKGMMR